MKRIVQRSIPNSGINQNSILGWLRDIVVPVLKETRQVVNKRFGEVTTVTAEYTITELDEVVLADTTGGAFSVYLPPVIEWTKTICIKRIGTANVTILPNADDTGVTIDGGPNVVLGTIYDVYQLVSNGYNWYAISVS